MHQFYGRLEKCVLSAGKTHVHKIPRFFLGGGGGYFGFGGGGGRFYFYGRADFSEIGAREGDRTLQRTCFCLLSTFTAPSMKRSLLRLRTLLPSLSLLKTLTGGF